MHFVIQTPRDRIFDGQVRAVRVPTETGQVGLRSRMEPMILAIEPGLMVIRTDGEIRFAASAGGLLIIDRDESAVYTPYAATGLSGPELLAALEERLGTPEGELAARRQLGELERHILVELGERRKGFHERYV